MLLLTAVATGELSKGARNLPRVIKLHVSTIKKFLARTLLMLKVFVSLSKEHVTVSTIPSITYWALILLTI